MLDLKAGARMILLIKDDKGDRKFIALSTTFERNDAKDKECFFIHAPILRDSNYPVPVGTVVRLQYTDPNAAYLAEGTVKDRVKEGDFAFLKIKQSGKPVRIQRREDFRLEIMLDGEIEKVFELNSDQGGQATKPTEPLRFVCRTTDLSGGGAALRTGMPYTPGEKTILYLPIDNSGSKRALKVEVRRCVPAKTDKAEYAYSVGVKFLHEDINDKEDLIQFLFKKQLERSRRRIR